MPHRLIPLLLAALLGAGCITSTPRTAGFQVQGIGSWFYRATGHLESTTWKDNHIEPTGWGVEANVYAGVPVAIVGYQSRDYQDGVTADEIYLGGKALFWQDGIASPYLHSVLRCGFGPDVGPSGSGDDYFGWGAGGGTEILLTDRFYLDFRVQYENLFSSWQAPDGQKIEMFGWVGTAGIGISF